MNLVEILDRNARRLSDKDALRYQGRGLTFSQLDDQARRAAAVFQSWGVVKGDRVAIMSYNTPSFPTAFFGALLAGAVVVPINHKLAVPEVEYIVDHSGAKVFLFDGALSTIADGLDTDIIRASLDTAAEGYDHFDIALETAGEPSPVEIADDDLAEFLYTSGTTGKPKGCMHSHRNVVMAGITAALAVQYTQDDVVLLAMPIWHSSPLNNWFMAAQYLGATTILSREYNPVEFLEAVQEEKCTVYFGAPISYLAPLAMVPNFDDYDLTSMRAWVYGGGPIDATNARVLMQKYRSDRFYQVYGMTEAGPSGMALFPSEQVAKAGSVGRTGLPGVDVKVMTVDGKVAGPGEVGEIWLKADSMMVGYYHDESATEAAFEDGWYRTGDVARIDEDGYLFIVDRVKDMIVAGGENVYSKEVEDVIMAHPAVASVAVIGRPHPEWGETVVAFVVAKPDTDTSGEDIAAFLGERLAKYKIPREFTFVDELPYTPSGKVMKYRLRTRFES
jgi:feruloyl-CoA synthase